ncbi:hypothetical protein [Victivallis sp. Marseille-Q1083]|uniref:hypothetical protein n=1 Tax=Victivallis sp. Marseille-Q1083 TaxID=2717288 RepID=UPI00158CBAC3|nr:hypothetical protein [Victivallis sp. Marseille-Q1083]
MNQRRLKAFWLLLASVSLVLLTAAVLLSRRASIETSSELPVGTVIAAGDEEMVAAVSPEMFAAGNIFHPLRGKAPPAETAAAGAPAVLPTQVLKLTGIFGYGSQAGAIITGVSGAPDAKQKPPTVFYLGDQVGDYTLLELTDRQAILERNGERLILPLKEKQP